LPLFINKIKEIKMSKPGPQNTMPKMSQDERTPSYNLQEILFPGRRAQLSFQAQQNGERKIAFNGKQANYPDPVAKKQHHKNKLR
jgi:hypothetical protein